MSANEEAVRLGVAAAIAELLREAEISGCVTHANGVFVQVDGCFQMTPVVTAVLAAARAQEGEGIT